MTLDRSPARPCTHCGHGEESHGDNEGFGCQRCMLIPIIREGVNPRHPYEPPFDPERRYFRRDMGGRVGTMPVGVTFTMRLRDYMVKAPCDISYLGMWVCITHNLRFADNMDKDIHCFLAGAHDSHVLLWACDFHGWEKAGD